jgi:hypothetical protein
MLPRTSVRVALFALLAVSLFAPPTRAQSTTTVRYRFGQQDDITVLSLSRLPV